jgi:hypothetical protein
MVFTLYVHPIKVAVVLAIHLHPNQIVFYDHGIDLLAAYRHRRVVRV